MSLQQSRWTQKSIAQVNGELASATAQEIVSWAYGEFNDQLVVTSSFADATIAHLAWSHSPDIDVALIDTQFLFTETVDFAHGLRERMAGSLVVLKTGSIDASDELWRTDVDACCAVRKVAPLERELERRQAWMTGLRRTDSPARALTNVVELDPYREIVKVNPIAHWSDADVDQYRRDHNLPTNPLTAKGYSSIGCWPCTQPITANDDPRAGRWAGSTKTECGLHVRIKVNATR